MNLKSTYQFKSQVSLIPCVKYLHRLHQTVDMTNDRRLTFTPVEEEENTLLGTTYTHSTHTHTHTQAKPVCVRAQVKRIVHFCSKRVPLFQKTIQLHEFQSESFIEYADFIQD